MKRLLTKISVVVACMSSMYACLPHDEDYNNINVAFIDSVNILKLCPSHHTLVADGKAELVLNVKLYEDYNTEILPSRIPEDWVEYYTADGEKLTKYLKTSDANKSQIRVYAQLKGYDEIEDENRKYGLKSDTLTIDIKKPLEENRYQAIKYPIVFHVIQTSDDIKNYGEVDTKRLMEYYNKLNQVFSGELGVAPTGGNAKISFELAEYDPLGRPLLEKGVNKYTLEKGSVGTDYYSFIASKRLVWDPQKYLNVWLIRGAEQPQNNYCRPYNSWENLAEEIPGLKMNEVPEGSPASTVPQHAGILLNMSSVTSYNNNVQDMVYYFGQYFGLLPNYSSTVVNNYCPDALVYEVRPNNLLNIGYTKKAYIDDIEYMFVADNIMDDPKSHHKTITLDQIERIRKIMAMCPERQAYKSDFAVTGK